MRYLTVLLLCLASWTAQSEVMNEVYVNDLQDENKQLSHKFRMASYLLSSSSIRSRIMSSSNDKARRLFKTAEDNFELVRVKINEHKWLEANAIIDSVLRDLTNASQILNKKNISRNQYAENIKRVESFIMPKWTDLSAEEKSYLANKIDEIEELMKQAEMFSRVEDFANANKRLDRVYSLKTSMLKALKHEDTIVYDHFFDSSAEEFEYMYKRSEHYLELVDSVLKNNSFKPQMMKLIDTYVQQGKSGMHEARVLEKDNQHEAAVVVLDKSIKNLSGALKIMGVRP